VAERTGVCDPCGMHGVLFAKKRTEFTPLEEKVIDGIIITMCVDAGACIRRAKNKRVWKV